MVANALLLSQFYRNVACSFGIRAGSDYTVRSSLECLLMDIRFISTLTADDEESFAPSLLQAIGSILDRLPIAYTVRIETTGARIFQHTHPALGRSVPSVAAPAAAGNGDVS